jgi:hypothetical protein
MGENDTDPVVINKVDNLQGQSLYANNQGSAIFTGEMQTQQCSGDVCESESSGYESVRSLM